MKKVVAIGELLIDFVPQQKGCTLDEVTHFERVAGGAPANVAAAVARLGGAPAKVHTVLLPVPPDGEAAEERRLLVIDKIAATPPAYPRPSAKIARQPL